MAANEFRQDLVSGEWVLISSLRSHRPHDEHRTRLYQAAHECVFEPDALKDQSDPVLVFDHGKHIDWVGDWNSPWTVAVIKNKYPVLQDGICGAPSFIGPFKTYAANGFHELVITRDHERHFAQFSVQETAEVLLVYRNRYNDIAKYSCGTYVSVFHNHGREAGASVFHNHSQIISTPIVPPEFVRSLDGADEYMMRTGRPVHETMIAWEVQQKKRIIYENDTFIAFCPFVSKVGYEMRVFPKKQTPRFETSTDADLVACADVLSVVLKKLYYALDDVDYNFYIHTAPAKVDSKMDVSAYHWHIEVVPRISDAAGFELSTAIYINPFDPDDCAEHLRNTKI